ncbi:unnamed protein product [Haemonchus placei]|uniref:DUF4218 domain-containing protein n=1 Tax=Haemonchus placei TaxID=6290 RepID=A0A0N4WCW6_HAEPC|nr:unnamed protein product [Haemonchus placei]
MHRKHRVETMLPVPVEECRQKALHHRYSHGEMIRTSGLWRMQNIIRFGFPSASFECCVDHSTEVTACDFCNTTVNAQHSDRSPQSPPDDIGHVNIRRAHVRHLTGQIWSGHMIVKKNSDQGYTVWSSQLITRQTLDSIGLVTSNQLAAQLLSVVGNLYNSYHACCLESPGYYGNSSKLRLPCSAPLCSPSPIVSTFSFLSTLLVITTHESSDS